MTTETKRQAPITPSSDLVANNDTVDGPAISRRLVLVFAVACGLVAANLYYAQPLLAAIAAAFHSSSGTVGLVATVTQAGYAIGLAAIVPLGDLLDRRLLIVAILCCTTVALLAAALAPSLIVLAAASLFVGLTSVAAQVLAPFAASLASDQERGRVVGTVMSGLLLGILLARTASGLVAGLVSGVLGHEAWRAIYGVAIVLMIGVNTVLWRVLPRSQRETSHLSYGALMKSIVPLIKEEAVLRRRSVYGALVFASFSVFWTSIAFLLARPPFDYSSAVIGLFGLVGVAGALCASVAGRLADRGLQRLSTPGFLLIALVSYVPLALGAHSILLLVAGVVGLDLGVQGTQITNQSEIYRLRPKARSRLTTVYMTSYFTGGAIGSATSALVFGAAGWTGVCLLGAAFAGSAVVFWLTEPRTVDVVDRAAA